MDQRVRTVVERAEVGVVFAEELRSLEVDPSGRGGLSVMVRLKNGASVTLWDA